jgi:AmmeMemoRadiSam system protein B
LQAGRQGILLRDPLRLTDKIVVVPQQLAPMLALCDGTRDGGGLRASLIVRHGVRVSVDVVDSILAALDEALLLDNDRFEQALERAIADYRQAPNRPPALAGQSYPADAVELRRLLGACLEQADDVVRGRDAWRGLVSPHIDFARGGPVYAQVWKQASEAARAADLVVILGTDHSGGPGQITLTRQSYATPFGTLPTATDIVDALSGAVGEQNAFHEELHHRGEHSIELAAVWLHHAREGQPCELVPILLGSFGGFLSGEAEPSQDLAIRALADTLRQQTTGRDAFIVAAADLSHVGPAFGGRPLDFSGRARLQAFDDEIIGRVCAGDAEGFFQAIRRSGDRSNVCGLPPIYVALRALEPVHGERVAYEQCPADQTGTSQVSVCGVVFA